MPAGSRCWQHLLGSLALAGALTLVVVSGFIPASGLLAHGKAPQDFNVFYAAGRCLWQGVDPYNLEGYSRVYENTVGVATETPWFYPPPAAPYVGALALLEPRAAMLALSTVNLASALVIACFAPLWVIRARPTMPVSRWPATLWLLPAVALATPVVTAWIRAGQVTLPAAALIMSGWLASRSRHDLLAGFLFGLATFKLQFVVLSLLWFLLERRWRLLGSTLVTSLVLSTPWCLQLGPWQSVMEWLANVRQYAQVPVNRLGHGLVMGIPSVLAAAGLPMPWLTALALASPLLVIGLWTIRGRVAPDALPGLLLGIHLVFSYGKYGDMVMLMPLLAGLWLLVGHRPASWPLLLAGTLVAWIPTRFFIAAGHLGWQHVKMVPFVMGFLALFVLAMQPRPGASVTSTTRA